MSRPSEEDPHFDDLVQTGTLAADRYAIGFVGTQAERTRAVVRGALEALIANGIVEVKPRGEWPEWIELDPPYTTPYT